MVLDVMMPRMSGLEVCKQLRAKRASLPIIMLTARGQEIDKVVGLELGADDYVTKPFSIRELLARVKSVLRRTAVLPKDKEQHSFSDVEVDLRRCRVVRSGKALEISSKEFDLLKYFICHPGETLSRDRLLEDVWGYENYPTTRTVDITWCGFVKNWSPIRNNHSTFDRARNRLPVRRMNNQPNRNEVDFEHLYPGTRDFKYGMVTSLTTSWNVVRPSTTTSKDEMDSLQRERVSCTRRFLMRCRLT